MRSEVQRILEMAGRALDFCRDHPVGGDQGYAAVVVRLAERLSHATELSDQELRDHQRVDAFTEQKLVLRREIREAMLVLAGIARGVRNDYPGLWRLTYLPPTRVSEKHLLTNAHSILSFARQHQGELLQCGLPAGLLEEFAQRISGFEAATSRKNLGTMGHVGASAGLAAVAKEIIRVVQQLDALHRHHYSKDAERMAGWKSARNVKWRRSYTARAK